MPIFSAILSGEAAAEEDEIEEPVGTVEEAEADLLLMLAL